MKRFLSMIKYDYLQRTRSYTFLITLCASMAIAYTFVPEPNANYSTLRIADYVGYYNAAWFGYVTAIMSSIFLSLVGFYLINSGIKRDSETKIGQVIAATSVSNFKYLLYKTVSNFLVLVTIVFLIFLMSIVLFFLYNDGYPFELLQFLKPYLLITIPALFLVAVLAVAFEVFFGTYSVVQNIGFFFLFSILLVYSPQTDRQLSYDIFGSKIVTNHMENEVQKILQTDQKPGLNIGFVLGNVNRNKKFEFNGLEFPTSFIISRLVWILLGLALVTLISPLFHRFTKKVQRQKKKQSVVANDQRLAREINILKLPLPEVDYGILPLLKSELLLLFRKGKKWLWIVNIIGMAFLVALPYKISHQIVLPIVWFLQVGRISEITTKEVSNNVHYFARTSYLPINRLLLSQALSGILLLQLLAMPLIVRLAILGETKAAFSIVLGGLLIVLFAAVSGMLSKGKKLFEVLFFMITYANINSIPALDYFGAFEHHPNYILQLGSISLIVLLTGILFKKYQLRE